MASVELTDVNTIHLLRRKSATEPQSDPEKESRSAQETYGDTKPSPHDQNIWFAVNPNRKREDDIEEHAAGQDSEESSDTVRQNLAGHAGHFLGA